MQFPPISLKGKEYTFTLWNGEVLPDKVLALDTETELIQEGVTPRLALAAVHGSAGSCVVIHPGDVFDFVTEHQDSTFVCHNAVCDFHVIAQHLGHGDVVQSDRASACRAESCGFESRRPRSVWWDRAKEGRIHCTMLFNSLIGLARNDEDPINKGLGMLSSRWCGVDLNKDDPWRLRYGELLGLTVEEWEDVDPAAWRYALADPIATLMLYQEQVKAASRMGRRGFDGYQLPKAVERFGLLTVGLQTQGAIALDAVSRRGVSIDSEYAEQVKEDIASLVAGEARSMEEMLGTEAFHRNAAGALSLTPAGAPRRNAKLIKGRLAHIAEHTTPPIIPPINKDGLVTDSVKYWQEYTDADPFVETYVNFMSQTKLLQFFKALKTDRIYPRYRPMVRTGRTSCSKPNLQQLPRDSRFREMILPSPGCLLLQVDYSVLELRTLAQVCISRFGESRMAELFREGKDLHRYTAATMLGLTMGDFGLLDKGVQKEHRQRAKALNFGVPGGLGAKSLSEYAKTAFGVTIDQDDAKKLRNQLIYGTYPELGRYLKGDSWDNLADNLHCSVEEVNENLRDWDAWMDANRIVAGQPANRKDKPYHPAERDRLWKALSKMNDNPQLIDILSQRQTGMHALRKIFFGHTRTLTGRIRGHVSYTRQKNSPFQGLAADGNKLALFNLVHAGYDVCGFVHDEALINIPEDCDLTAAVEDVQRIMRESMEVFTPDVPIETSGLLADRWYKDVDANEYDDQGNIIPFSKGVLT